MGIRIMVKGGVWKNTEDEILKAAVMKYGLNQWPRVASLLNRKSAAQCKARWYEWLDPSIKKTEWTREEEEKLLHLAKILPSQWRTIAPLVGRTPAQCLEHYERLLDAVQQKAGDIDGEAKDDPRRLRPGEIDPAPETKPARPDPIDMDEDEKEMLSEARARLQNTKGKKAKRKAREKMLSEAKRLASLQKRRELKAAGIELKMREKKRKYIDYGREIPFQRTAPAGFYDTADEKDAGKKQALDPTFEALRVDKLEEKRRDEEEAKNKGKDRKRQKRLAAENLPMQVMQVNNLNDPVAVRKRGPLSLPAPQVTDAELDQIAKMGLRPDMLAGGSHATAALLGNYQEIGTPLATPMRTPKRAENVIEQEARNLLRLTQADTPLKGGDSIVLEEGTGFEGHMPRPNTSATPNVLLSQQREGRAGSATPLSQGTPLSIRSGATGRSAQPGGSTPMRDELGLNQGGNMELMLLSQKRRERAAKAQLLDGLEGLPEPQYTYDLSVPDLPEEEEKEDAREEDAADRDARAAAKKRALEEAELERRSTAIKQDLPRPVNIAPDVFNLPKVAGDDLAAADALIQKEVLAVLQHDAWRYPVRGARDGKKKKGSTVEKVQIPVIDVSHIKKAHALVEEEAAKLVSEDDLPSEADFEEAWQKSFGDLAFFPERKIFGRLSTASKQERLSATAHQFEQLAAMLEKDAKKVSKLEQRVSLITGGYQKRATALLESIQQAFDEIDTMELELHCFKVLQKIEGDALGKRVNKLQTEVRDVEAREEGLQQTYVDLLEERQRIYDAIVAHQQTLNPSEAHNGEQNTNMELAMEA